MATRRKRWRWAMGSLLVVQGAALAASCAPGVGEEDCEMLVSALGVVQSRCVGGDAGPLGQLVIEHAANYNCANITSIRNDNDLVNECIPCLQDASCYDAAALCADDPDASLPDACLEQLQL